MRVLELDALIAAERYRDAAALATRLTEEDLESADAWLVRIRRTHIALVSNEVALDDALIDLEGVTEARGLSASVAAEAYAGLIDGYAAKRCWALVAEATRASRKHVGTRPSVTLAEARAALTADLVSTAGRKCEAVLDADPDNAEAHFEAARLRCFVGDPEQALAHLDEVTGDAEPWARATRLRAELCAAIGEPLAEAGHWAAVIEERPSSDRSAEDHLRLGMALSMAGRPRDAGVALHAAWRLAPGTRPGRQARQHALSLRRTASALNKRLAVSCRSSTALPLDLPPVIRAALAHLPEARLPDTSGRAVGPARDRESLLAVVDTLTGLGVATRRVEASPHLVREAVNLSLPTIIWNDLAAPAPPVVAVGYDDALGIVITIDPRTHRQGSLPMALSSRDTWLGSHALVVIGRSDHLHDSLRDACASRGLADADHLLQIDACDRAGPLDPESEPQARAHLARCEEAARRFPGSLLVELRRWRALERYRELTGDENAEPVVARRLAQLSRFGPLSRWTARLYGAHLASLGRPDEAVAAFEQALAPAPGDTGSDAVTAADVAAAAGECAEQAGWRADALGHLHSALATDPAHLRANENLAALYLDEVAATRHDNRWQSWLDDPAWLCTGPRGPSTGDIGETVALARARHFSRVAVSRSPGNPFNQELAGRLALLDGRWSDAAAAFRSVLERDPARMTARLGFAAAMELDDRPELAAGVLDELIAAAPASAPASLTAAAFRYRRGDTGGATNLLESAASPLADSQTVWDALYDLIASTDGVQAAASAIAARGSLSCCVRAARTLDANGHRGTALTVLRSNAAGDEGAEGHLRQERREAASELGLLLSQDPLCHDEAASLLMQLISEQPDADDLRTAAAWCLAGRDRSKAMEVLRPAVDRADWRALDTRAALLSAAGAETDAEVSSRTAIELAGGEPAGRMRLVRWHLDQGRPTRAVALASGLRHLTMDAERVRIDAYFRAGMAELILDDLRCRYGDDIPPDLAEEIFRAAEGSDDLLAAAAARRVADSSADPRRRLGYRIAAALAQGRLGDTRPLDQLHQECGRQAWAWAEIGRAHLLLGQVDAGSDAASRALASDDTEPLALALAVEVALCRNEIPSAVELAGRLDSLHGELATGAVQLALAFAKSQKPSVARRHAARALALVPFSSTAHTAMAAARFAGGDLGAARTHAERALELDAGRSDAGHDATLILAALAGRVEEVQEGLRARSRLEPGSLFLDYKKLLVATARARRDITGDLGPLRRARSDESIQGRVAPNTP